MEAPDVSWMAEQRFSCKPPQGAAFAVTARIGAPEIVEKDETRPFRRCRIGLDPLAKDRWVAGANGFQALCLSLDYIRRVFKVFAAEGGRIYWEHSAELADLDSPSFTPMLDLGRVGLRLDGSTPFGSAE